MSQFNQSHIPQNFVGAIVGRRVSLRNMSSQMIETVKGMGAFQIPAGTEMVWVFECVDDDELVQTLQELNRLGFLFAGGPSGWPAADMFALLLERKKLSARFKEITWRGPGDWYIIER